MGEDIGVLISTLLLVVGVYAICAYATYDYMIYSFDYMIYSFLSPRELARAKLKCVVWPLVWAYGLITLSFWIVKQSILLIPSIPGAVSGVFGNVVGLFRDAFGKGEPHFHEQSKEPEGEVVKIHKHFCAKCREELKDGAYR